MSVDEPATEQRDADETEPVDSARSSELDRRELVARVETLEAENERLRDAVSTAHRRRYRYTALGLAIVGLIAVGSAFVFPGVETVLLALGGTGLFAAILTYFLTPERFVAASVGERIYATMADNEQLLVADLDLRGDPTIIPTTGSTAPARLFVSQGPDDEAPSPSALSAPFVTDGPNGLSLKPTGAALYETLLEASGTLPGDPAGLSRAVGDALVEQFELVDAVDVDVADQDDEGRADRVTLAVDGSAYGDVDRFDHPVASLLATTLAVELDTPVRVSVEAADRADWLVTCRF